MPARGRTGHRRLTIAVDPGGDASYKSVMPLPAPLPADGPLRPACTVLCAVCLAGVPAPPTRAEGPPTPQYMCIVNGVDDFTRDFPPPSPADDRMACSGSIHYTLLRTPAEIAAEMNAVLDGAETSGYPLFVNLDDWNFPRAAWAGDPGIVEWTAWDGTLATYRDIEWRTDNPQRPPPNVESPAFRAEIAPVFDAAFGTLASRLKRWRDQGRGYLLAGVAVGWESGYYTEFDGPAPFRTGFAALTARGLTDAAIAAAAANRGVTYWEEFDAQMYRAIHDYIAWLCERAVRAGLPREKLFTHFTGVPDDWRPPDPARRDGRLVPFSLAGNPFARPGHTATPEWIDLERLALEAPLRDTPDWGAPEWEGTPATGSRDAMLRFLSRLHGLGAQVSCNWGGWWGAPFNPFEVHDRPGMEGMQAWLSGETLLGIGAPVDRSTVVGPLDYSDTFTEGINGRVADGRFPVTGAALDVENRYGNPPRTWSGGKWSLRKDGNLFWTAASPDPQGSWAGSRTGITETGGPVDFGIEYGLRDDFVLQADIVQSDGDVALTTAEVRDTTEDDRGLSVYFRPAGRAIEVGLFNHTIGERDTGFRPALAAGSWHSYAARFDLVRGQVTVYADGVQLGTLDLASFAGGAFAGLAVSNAAVSVGVHPQAGNRAWTDNVAVGAPCPEPALPGDGLRVTREGSDLMLDWRREPGPAFAWRVYELSGPDFSSRTPLADTPERRERLEGAATASGGSRFFAVAARNDCGDERP